MQVTIMGAGGHARSMKHMLEQSNSDVHVRLVHKENEIAGQGFENGIVLIGIGDNKVRMAVYNRWSEYTAIFSAGSIYAEEMNRFGDGCQIMHMVYIGPDAIIGANAILNTGCIIEHGCTIEPHAHIGPGAILCGDVTIGEGSFVGAGAVITPGKRVEPWRLVRAGERV